MIVSKLAVPLVSKQVLIRWKWFTGSAFWISPVNSIKCSKRLSSSNKNRLSNLHYKLGPENNLNNNSLAHESEGVSVYCSCMMTLDSGYGASWWFGCKSIFTSLLKRPKVCGQMSGLDFIVHCSIGSDPVPIDDIVIADQLQFDCGCDHSCSLRLRWRNKIRCLFACCWLVNRWWLFGS